MQDASQRNVFQRELRSDSLKITWKTNVTHEAIAIFLTIKLLHRIKGEGNSLVKLYIVFKYKTIQGVSFELDLYCTYLMQTLSAFRYAGFWAFTVLL